MNSNEKLNATELTLLKMLWQMQYASASDLKGWPFVSASRVEPNLNLLLTKGLIVCEILGWMRDAQRRYVLLDEGTDLVTELTGWRPTWFQSDAGKMNIRSRGPMVECFYHVAPRIWSPDLVRERPNSRPGVDEDFRGHLYYYDPEAYWEMEPDVHAEPQPDSFTWLRQGPLHALVGMHPGSEPHRFWVPLVWYGTHGPKDGLPSTLDRVFDHLETEPDPNLDAPARPPGVVIVAADALAAALASREMPRTMRHMIITYETYSGDKRRFGMSRVYPMVDVPFPSGFGCVLGANGSISTI